MSTKTPRPTCLRRCLVKTEIKRLSGAILVLMVMLSQHVNAQDLVLRDTTLATAVTFSANSIAAGPNLTIASTGEVILSAGTLTVIPKFFVVSGGKFQVVSGTAPVSVETAAPTVMPDEFIVHQNFPNPFNPETEIRFALPQDSHVVVTIYNALGQGIRTLTNTRFAAGFHSVNWDGKDKNGNPVSSGVYIYQMQAGEFSQVRKMSLIR